MKIVVLGNEKIKELNKLKDELERDKERYVIRLESANAHKQNEGKLWVAYQKAGDQEKANEHFEKYLRYGSEFDDLVDKAELIIYALKIVNSLM